jgi:putative phosphoesterase
MQILIIGDLHIPFRAREIPRVFREFLQPIKVHQILCTGNLTTRTTHDFLRTISGDILIVRGELDEEELTAEEEIVSCCGSFRVGIVSNYRILSDLSMKQRELGVDILIHGGSCQAKAEKVGTSLFLDPGSMTGVTGTTPSFIIMTIQGETATVNVYSLTNDQEFSTETIAITKVP